MWSEGPRSRSGTGAAALAFVPLVALALCGGGGCGTPAAAPSDPPPSVVVAEEELNGFDPGQEPVLQTLSDGSLRVRFAQLPPRRSGLDAGPEAEMGPYDELDRDLAAAIGRAVEWPSRTDLIIPAPADDTPQRVRAFLAADRR